MFGLTIHWQQKERENREDKKKVYQVPIGTLSRAHIIPSHRGC